MFSGRPAAAQAEQPHDGRSGHEAESEWRHNADEMVSGVAGRRVQRPARGVDGHGRRAHADDHQDLRLVLDTRPPTDAQPSQAHDQAVPASPPNHRHQAAGGVLRPAWGGSGASRGGGRMRWPRRRSRPTRMRSGDLHLRRDDSGQDSHQQRAQADHDGGHQDEPALEEGVRGHGLSVPAAPVTQYGRAA